MANRQNAIGMVQGPLQARVAQVPGFYSVGHHPVGDTQLPFELIGNRGKVEVGGDD
jgi:hypothetical protein